MAAPVRLTQDQGQKTDSLGARAALCEPPVLLQIVVHKGESFFDKPVHIEPSSDPGVVLEIRPNTIHHGTRAATIRGDLREILLGSINLRRRAIKPAQAFLRSGL